MPISFAKACSSNPSHANNATSIGECEKGVQVRTVPCLSINLSFYFITDSEKVQFHVGFKKTSVGINLLQDTIINCKVRPRTIINGKNIKM